MLIRPLYANYRAPCFFFIRIYEICEIYERKKHRGERWSYSNEHCQWPIWLEDGRANQGALTSPVGLAMTSRILHWRLPFLPFSLSLFLSYSIKSVLMDRLELLFAASPFTFLRFCISRRDFRRRFRAWLRHWRWDEIGLLWQFHNIMMHHYWTCRWIILLAFTLDFLHGRFDNIIIFSPLQITDSIRNSIRKSIRKSISIRRLDLGSPSAAWD